MLLTIDVGNSDTVFGLFEGEDLLEHWRVSSKGRRTADEWAVVVQNLLHFDSLIHGDIDGIAMCCTATTGTVTGYLNDLWKYNITEAKWHYIAGSPTINATGQFGPDEYSPGARTSASTRSCSRCAIACSGRGERTCPEPGRRHAASGHRAARRHRWRHRRRQQAGGCITRPDAGCDAAGQPERVHRGQRQPHPRRRRDRPARPRCCQLGKRH